MESPLTPAEVARISRRALGILDGSGCDNRVLGVVILPGSFNPPHVAHRACLEAARVELERRGIAVIAGIYQPSSDKYLQTKCGKDSAMLLSDRLQACELAGNDAPDPDWFGVWRTGEINGSKATAHCQAWLGDRIRGSARALPAFELTCFQVCGADTVDRCGGIERSVSPPRIVVSRPGTRLAGTPGAGWILTNTEVSELSSTRIRAALKLGQTAELDAWLGPSVCTFCQKLSSAGVLYGGAQSTSLSTRQGRPGQRGVDTMCSIANGCVYFYSHTKGEYAAFSQFFKSAVKMP